MSKKNSNLGSIIVFLYAVNAAGWIAIIALILLAVILYQLK